MRLFRQETEKTRRPLDESDVSLLREDIRRRLEDELERRFKVRDPEVKISTSAAKDQVEFMVTIDIGSEGEVAFIAGGGASLSFGDVEARAVESEQLIGEIQAAVSQNLRQGGWTVQEKSIGWYNRTKVKSLAKEAISTDNIGQTIPVKHLVGWVITNRR